MIVEYEKRGRTAVITLNRPEARNAVTGELAQALEEEGAVLAQANPIEIDPKTKKPKEGVADGLYYDQDGKVYKVEDGKPSIIKIK